jgi:hypothetical protein
LFRRPAETWVPDASISLIAPWNAGRTDNANPNGEYVIVRNTGGTVVDLSGWILRDSGSTAWFTFPNGSVLTPDDYRVVHVGQGTPGSPEPRDLYMGSTTALLANVARDRFTGDGVYLLDPSTAFRSWFDWPCVVDCMDAAQGKLTITDVNPIATSKKPSRAANEEYIIIKNTSKQEINLDGYYVAMGLTSVIVSFPWAGSMQSTTQGQSNHERNAVEGSRR